MIFIVPFLENKYVFLKLQKSDRLQHSNWIVYRFGRKVMIFGSQLVASTALLGTILLHYCVEEKWPVIVLCWIANVGCVVSFSCSYSITKELFPTPLRYIHIYTKNSVSQQVENTSFFQNYSLGHGLSFCSHRFHVLSFHRFVVWIPRWIVVSRLWFIFAFGHHLQYLCLAWNEKFEDDRVHWRMWKISKRQK